MLVSMLTVFGAPAVFAGAAKVEVCHVPPDNPDNFHTITISENALAAHLAHGDIEGACNAVCATLCDDGDACTIDDTGDCELVGCPVTPEAVDCNDSLLCTVDACDSTIGCVYPDVVCDEGQTCNPDNGICEDDVSCPCYGVSEGAATWNSDFPADGGIKTAEDIFLFVGTSLQLEATSTPSNGGTCAVRAGTSLEQRSTTQAQHDACYAELLDIGVNLGIFTP